MIIPYRDRAAHLAELLPALQGTLSEGLLRHGYDCAIHVVEQLDARPFNRGKLLNCGAAIAGAATDYFILHDVDYVPLAADYGWVHGPTRLIWYGLALWESYDTFFGAVTAMPRRQFELVNGYSNDYWGWGSEDVDLRFRCESRGLALAHRDGRFRSLPHRHNGFAAPGVLTPEAEVTHALLRERLPSFQEGIPREGLSTLQMDLAWTKRVETERAGPAVLHHGVRL